MDFQETIDYLYHQLPVFQNSGAKALNLKLENTLKLCDHLNNPHERFKSIHVAGTNGKGSTSHMITSVLMESGYRTGLYTSPHLKSFTERIKINGVEIPEEYVIDFVVKNKHVIENWGLSFFELTVGMCFQYFADSEIDVAVIETGMGGRLDSTNVITPILSIITNVSLDHQQYLGDTIQKIATEKAGIIKPQIDAVIGNYNPDYHAIFTAKCKELRCEMINAEKTNLPVGLNFKGYQLKNAKTAYTALKQLETKFNCINDKTILKGLKNFEIKTGLKGRWQKLNDSPIVICDTGHNVDGIKEVLKNIEDERFKDLRIVFGTVSDKDHNSILELLPKKASYYFCTPKINRALNAEELSKMAASYGLNGTVIHDVNDAISEAIKNSENDDLIFVGGSTFVVAEIDNL